MDLEGVGVKLIPTPLPGISWFSSTPAEKGLIFKMPQRSTNQTILSEALGPEIVLICPNPKWGEMTAYYLKY